MTSAFFIFSTASVAIASSLTAHELRGRDPRAATRPMTTALAPESAMTTISRSRVRRQCALAVIAAIALLHTQIVQGQE